MTFEEFLTKKKIDLAQFKAAEPSVFSEFQNHYGQMGEKSFDHSKKFLFNKLRRAYHLKEDPKPAISKEIIEINEIASQAEPLLSPTVEATVYTPRFRSPGTLKQTPPPPDSPEADPAEEGSEPKNGDKPAYKPRFKAPGSAAQKEPENKADIPPAEPAKVGFKPRFKPSMVKPKKEE